MGFAEMYGGFRRVNPWVVAGAIGTGLALLATAASGAASGLVRYTGLPTEGELDSRGNRHRTPAGPRYAVRNIPPFPGTVCAWAREMLALVERQGFRGKPAKLLIAHIARETGFGRSLWNNAFGNVKQFDAYARNHAWHRLSDHEPYMAFQSADDGMRYMIAVIRGTGGMRRQAYNKLMAGDQTWYGDLGRSQYYGDAPRNDAAAIEAAAVRGQREYDQSYWPTIDRCLP